MQVASQPKATEAVANFPLSPSIQIVDNAGQAVAYLNLHSSCKAVWERITAEALNKIVSKGTGNVRITNRQSNGGNVFTTLEVDTKTGKTMVVGFINPNTKNHPGTTAGFVFDELRNGNLVFKTSITEADLKGLF